MHCRLHVPLLALLVGFAGIACAADKAEKAKKWVLGKFKDQTEIVGDIIAPIDVEWEAMSDRS